MLAAVAATISATPEYAGDAAEVILTAGYGTALLVAGGILVTAGVLALTTLNGHPTLEAQKSNTSTDELTSESHFLNRPASSRR
ncbi:hypothetical protein IG195_22120 (plasmid) [Arthrobacter sp. TES]|nr:hypothetical protein IG195_22120 [Arthrobacter sp. TES]